MPDRKIPENQLPPGSPGTGLPQEGTAYIWNPFHGKQLLTPDEALDMINRLSGSLLIDGRKRGR